MNRQVKQVLGLSVFAAGCMALGMGLSHGWVAAAQEEKPVVVDTKGARERPAVIRVVVLGLEAIKVAVATRVAAATRVARELLRGPAWTFLTQVMVHPCEPIAHRNPLQTLKRKRVKALAPAPRRRLPHQARAKP